LVTSRLERLPGQHANVVRAAAVIGNVVPPGLLAAACDGAPDRTTMQALADADFLHADPDGGLRFKHGITRDAVYDTIGLQRRRTLHQRVEAALVARSAQTDREDTLEALAHHCRGAGNWENASLYAERAGDRAMSAFALDRARSQYQAAIETLDRIPHRTREDSLRWCLLTNKLGMACIFDPLSLSNDVGVFERAVTLARTLGDTNALARAHYWLGYMCYGFGQFREAAVHARRALATAREAGDLRLAAQIEATLGQILAATCEYDEAIALLDSAVSAKQQRSRPGGGVAIGSAYALSCKAALLADRGDFDTAHACFDEATRLLDGSPHPVANSVRNWTAVALIWQGRWQEADRLSTESARIAEDMRGLLLLAACRAAAGFARWSATRDPDALQQLRDAVRWMEGRSFRFYVSVQYAWLVEACAAEGDVATVLRYVVHVLRRARDGERLGEAAACRAMVKICVSRGKVASGERWLQRAETSARLRGSVREAALNQVARAQLHEHRGEAEAACGEMAKATASLQRLGMHWHIQQNELSRSADRR
jgi:tetratricopeptide (TPR) repeat protein